MQNKDSISDLLKSHNLKNTIARRRILEFFTSSKAALSYPTLEELLGEELDRVTIYRTLKSFEQKGVIHQVIDDGSLVKYALCQNHCKEGHHHDSHVHFKCEICEETYCLDSTIPAFNALSGYRVKKIEVLAQGVCDTCNSTLN